MATPEEKTAISSERTAMATEETNDTMQEMLKALAEEKAAADARYRAEEKKEKEKADAEKKEKEDRKKAEKEENKKVLERKLLGQTEEQYEETLAQRKETEKSKEELDKIATILGDGAKDNLQFQAAQRAYNKEQLKLAKLESRRALFQRFKTTASDRGTGAAVADIGRGALQSLKSFGKKLSPIIDFTKRFIGIFKLAIIPLLVLFVNSPAFETAKEKIKEFIRFLDPGNPDGPFGPNGFMSKLIEEFGAFNIAMAGIIGLISLKALGLSGLKAIFVGLKATILAIKVAFVTVLTTLATFFGIGVAPLVGIIAGIAALGYAIYDTFVEVKKKFDEGASVGELIQTAVVEFFGALGGILDFVKDLLAATLDFLGFKDIAFSFRSFSIEKGFEKGLNFLIDEATGFFSRMFDFFTNKIRGYIQGIINFVKKIPGVGFLMESLGIDTTEKAPKTPEEKAREKKIEEAKEAKETNIRRIERERDNLKDEMKMAKANLRDAQKDVETEGKGGLKFMKESEDEKRRDDLRLFNERERREELEEAQIMLELELKKAKSAPVIVNGETINLNEGQKTETNFAQTLSMVPTGTAGKLSRGAGSMALEAE